jgi:hypothetical protein
MIYSFNTNCMRMPIGGHHYKIDKPLSLTLKADDLDDLVVQLTDFRINNGIPLGEPLQDILLYYKQNWPYLVVQQDGDTQEVGIRFSIWRSWIHRTWANPPKTLVPNKVAEERHKICQNCKYNKKITWTSTEEAKELKRRAFMLRRGIDVPNYLGYCSFHGCDLGVMTLLDNAGQFVVSDTQYKDCFLEKEKLKETNV